MTGYKRIGAKVMFSKVVPKPMMIFRRMFRGAKESLQYIVEGFTTAQGEERSAMLGLLATASLSTLMGRIY